jgi:aromatic ring-opening dioxygenase catalytic subunit (LigB family)
MPRGAIISLSHGGGPLPLLGDPNHKDIVESLKTTVPKILKLNGLEAPRAIVLVTAHWSEPQPTISSADQHPLYYDYYNFPPETYELKYDAPGSAKVAQEVYDAFAAAGLQPKKDSSRGTGACSITISMIW